jgi:hypothetical protein
MANDIRRVKPCLAAESLLVVILLKGVHPLKTWFSFAVRIFPKKDDSSHATSINRPHHLDLPLLLAYIGWVNTYYTGPLSEILRST